jgi:hypothetical protein
VVYLQDGRVIQVLTDGGEGFFRQQTISGNNKTISTHECFVANGRWKLLTLFPKGGEMTSEPIEVPEDDEPDEDDDEKDDDE